MYKVLGERREDKDTHLGSGERKWVSKTLEMNKLKKLVFPLRGLGGQNAMWVLVLADCTMAMLGPFWTGVQRELSVYPLIIATHLTPTLWLSYLLLVYFSLQHHCIMWYTY